MLNSQCPIVLAPFAHTEIISFHDQPNVLFKSTNDSLKYSIPGLATGCIWGVTVSSWWTVIYTTLIMVVLCVTNDVAYIWGPSHCLPFPHEWRNLKGFRPGYSSQWAHWKWGRCHSHMWVLLKTEFLPDYWAIMSKIYGISVKIDLIKDVYSLVCTNKATFHFCMHYSPCLWRNTITP